MRLIVVPRDRLLALKQGANGFLHALLTLEQDPDPRFSVIRSLNHGQSTWHIQVGPHVLPLDSKNVEAMAAAVPIYLIDLVHELQVALSEVMLKPGTMEGVEKHIPFIRTLKKDEPSWRRRSTCSRALRSSPRSTSFTLRPRERPKHWPHPC